MNRGMYWMAPTLALGLLVGCGGAATPGDVAAQACDAQVRTQLDGKPYTLDLKMLAETMRDDGRGGFLLASQVTVEAGLANQSVQTLECTVRMAADNASAEVLNVRFIW
ncbi:hypothetical protein GCM10028794_05420 [Silanimonas algicola]